MRVCSTCTTTSDDAGRFCPACGAAATAVAADSHGAEANAATAELQQNSSTTNLVGSVIDGFAIDAILGGGAFGTVYRGRQLGLDREVAIKVPTIEMAGDPITARRFAREARSAARVDHPGVVTIYAVGELRDGRPYLAMQLIAGEPLDKILEAGPLSAVRALRLVRLVASALSETHAMSVVHRDLKPSNIMWRLDRNGDDRITLVDFGIAVCKPGNADATRLTGANLIGTPHYMSPEQAHGEEVDGRADLYALGCIMYELVTGTTPFEGSGFEVLLAHLGRPPPVPSTVNAELPEAIDRLVAALLEKKPDARPQTADELVALIDVALAELAGKDPAATTPRLPRRKRPKPLPTTRERPLPAPGQRSYFRLAVMGLVAIVLVGGAGFVALRLSGHTIVATDTGRPDDLGADAAKRREIVSDDGTFLSRVSLPEVLRAKVPVRGQITILTKLGGPLVASEVVVTIEDAKGAATGFPARHRVRDATSYFGFRHTFPESGHYVMRIFPPESDSVFRIELDVL